MSAANTGVAINAADGGHSKYRFVEHQVPPSPKMMMRARANGRYQSLSFSSDLRCNPRATLKNITIAKRINLISSRGEKKKIQS
jgi:hypothetical protein